MKIDSSALEILSKAQGFKACMIGTLLLLSAIFAIVSQLLDAKWLAKDIFTSRFVATAVIAVVVACVWIAVRWQSLHRDTFKSKHVFVAFPSLDNEPFHVDLLRGVVATLTPEFSVTLWLPQRGSEYKGSAFEDFLATTRRDSALYIGGIILPTVVDHSNPKRIAGLTAAIDLPIVIVDTLPEAFLKDGHLEATQQFVGYSNVIGGRQAAEALCKELEEIGRKPNNVLVLHAKEQTDRHEAFVAEVRKRYPAAQFDLSECGWQRDRAREAVDFRIGAATMGRYDGVFGCNDEMAIGAVEAISRWNANHSDKLTEVVIGYDGSPTARTLMQLGTTPLRNLVVQDGYNLGVEAATRLRGSLKTDDWKNATETSLPHLLHTKLLRPYPH